MWGATAGCVPLGADQSLDYSTDFDPNVGCADYTPGPGSRTRRTVPIPVHPTIHQFPGACYVALILSDGLCLAAGSCGHLMTMMTYEEQVSARSDTGDVIDTRTLWTGGVVTAVIVGGLTIVGFLLIEGTCVTPSSVTAQTHRWRM